MSTSGHLSPEASEDSVFPLSVDRSATLKVKQRFLNINRTRFRRVYDSLGPHQQCFLDLLPLLFHTNHALIPGYVDGDCPSGLSDYSPGKRTLAQAKKHARSFSLRKGAVRQVDIYAIYLMGSSGTIAQSSESDFDIWLCHRSSLDKVGVEKLQQKCEAIESWAGGLGLEVHFFVMCDEVFQQGEVSELSSESSGTAQHYLLLDEFYRTGVLVEGRAPIWWLVPPDVDREYAEFIETMTSHRFIQAEDYLDFGPVEDIKPEEFFGATLWQLSKAIDAPYKSLLKILLLEAYASDYPRLDFLSSRYKEAVYAGELNVQRLDPYVLLYQKVEEHLRNQNDRDRLELARRCLYFKVDKSWHQISKSDDWASLAIGGLVNEWDWSEAVLRSLDARHTWKVDRALEERNGVVSALTHSYKLLSLFARENANVAALNQSDMTILGRKLFTAFEHKSGKIDVVNPGVCKDLSESHLYLHYVEPVEGSSYWLLHREPRPTEKNVSRNALRRTWTVTESIVWSHFNGLLTGNTRTIVEGKTGEMSGRDIEVLSGHLRKHFPVDLPKKYGVEALATQARLTAAGTFINFTPQPDRHEQVMTSARTDALSYSGWHENLVHSIDYLIVTSWGEILTHQYHGIEGLIACLCEHLRWLIRSGRNRGLSISHCCEPRYGNTIERRITDLFDAVIDWFFDSPETGRSRYVLRAGDKYYALIRSGDQISQEFDGSFDALLEHLGQASEKFTQTHFDEHALDDLALDKIFAANREGVVQFFYRVKDQLATVYVLDEHGSLFVDEVPFFREASLLDHFAQFFESVEFRQRSSLHTDTLGHSLPPELSLAATVEQTAGQFTFPDLEFCQLRLEKSDYHLTVKNFQRTHRPGGFFDVKVVGELTNGQTEFIVYVNGQEFSVREFGKQLFEKVTGHILARRASGEPYPIYITDVDLSWLASAQENDAPFHTIHYLQYKKRIEHKLNTEVAKKAQAYAAA